MQLSQDRRKSPPPRGFTLMEVTVAAVALGLLSVAVMQATFALKRLRQATASRDYASRELDNLMERFVHQPWESITQSTAAELTVPDEVATRLPAAELQTLVMDEAEPVDAKRITMQLRWRAYAGEHGKPLKLTAWVFRPREESL